MRVLASLLLRGTIVALLAATPIFAALQGPSFPAPGGTTFSAAPPGGSAGDAGGLTFSYSNINVGKFDKLYWGMASANAFKVSLTGPGGLTSLAYNAGMSNLAVGRAVWTHTMIPYNNPTPGGPSGPLRVRLVVRQVSPAASGFVVAPLEIAFADAVIDVLTTGPAYQVHLRFEAEIPRNSGSWTAINALQQASAGLTLSEFSAGFFSTALGGCCTNGPGTDSECIVTTQEDCETNHSLYIGDCTDCSGVLDCTVLFVTMESMSATATPHGVLLSWTTVTEVDTVGFRLLREMPGAREKAMRVIAPMIPASGTGLTGATYQFLDNTLGTGSAANYFIEDIDIFGKVTRHGPIVVERVAPTRAAGDRRKVPTR